MTAEQIRQVVLDILSRIAPDEDLSNLDDEVAFRLVEALMHDHAVAIVCPESTRHENRMARMDAERVVGSMSSPLTLREAHIEVG